MELSTAFIPPPPRLPLYLRIPYWVARRFSGLELLPVRLLAWYPKAAVSSSIMEGLIAHQDGRLGPRILKMVRMVVSFTVNCPYCMDLNSLGWEKYISVEELRALQGRTSMEEVPSLTGEERLAVEYARAVSDTPLSFPPALVERLRRAFSPREMVVLATTAAQVNYWARLIQALGCPPETHD
jgi:alkylhydroperoxidase family enzyme